LFGLADLAMDSFLYPGSLRYTLGVRFGTLPIHAALLGRLYLQPVPSPRLLRVCELGMFTLAVAGISVMMIPLGGLNSIYFGGVLLCVGVRGAFKAERWQDGILPCLLIVGAHVAAVVGGLLLVPSRRAELLDPGLLASFVIQLCFIVCAAAFGVIAANTFWTLRRQVFEARSIGKYRLVRAIGQGGMGEVWRAYHPGLKRDVAVKLVRPDRDPTLTHRFEREVQATIRLSHPNTIRVFDYGVTEDGISYYVMELLEGCNLKELVTHDGPLDPARALYLGAQAASALAEAHDLGIVHRDIKPENIFVTAVGRTSDFVKILDFGIAKAISHSESTSLTRTGVRMGTPGYIAPEVFSGGDVDARADVYALGAVLYFMLAGAPPFRGDDERAVVRAQLAGALQPLGVAQSGVMPSSLEAIIRRCLCADPALRFADASELFAAMSHCDDIAAWKPGPPRPLPANRPSATASRSTASAAIAVGFERKL
jgi:serine/threonine-protein kinase